MLNRSTKTLDTNRAGEAVSRPGIDPRIWASTAVVRKRVVDPEHGVFVDVLLLPSQVTETARVASVYAGPGFGLYFPIDVGDEVLVVAPSGDPDAGLVAMPRLWSAADAPPADIGDHKEDLLLFAKQDATVRIVSTGAGNLVLDPRGSGKVMLGGEDGLEPAVLGQTLQNWMLQQLYVQVQALFDALNAAVTVFNGHVHGGVTPGAPTDLSGVPTSLQAPDAVAITQPPNIEAQKVEVK